MPPPSPGAPILYDFYLDPSLEAWSISEDDDDDGGFRWQPYFSRRSFWQGVVRASQSLGVKNKRAETSRKKKKKKSRAKKKPNITSEKEYMPPFKTPFTLGDCNPKGPLGSDSSNDDPTEGEVAQYCIVS